MKNFPSEKRIVNEFFKWIKIDSPSGKEEQISIEIIKRLKRLGITVELDKIGNIKGIIEASIGFEKYPARCFAAHIDTVQPGEKIKPILKNGVITSSEDTILGADNKDGVTVIMLAVEYILNEKIPHPKLELLFTVREEQGVTGTRMLKKGWLESNSAWVFDGPGKIGIIYKGAVGAAEFKIEIRGKAAHAGLCPERGINALKAAAKAITRIKIGRVGPNLTVNLGIFNSGVARNIVPELATVYGEIRSKDIEKIEKNLSKIKKIFKDETKKSGAKFFFESHIAYYPFSLKTKSRLIKETSKKLKKLGIKPSVAEMKAGTDANNFYRQGIESLIVAMGREGDHTINESTTIKNIILVTFMALSLMSIANHNPPQNQSLR